ncbi:MAG: ABC transporter substrate-binding protein [Pelagimonas sp.]|jgi:peptide/nickel transport system substrate-binding protein|nr:ABC transporter substrate-binding protein [Pelagimonas sp.]
MKTSTLSAFALAATLALPAVAQADTLRMAFSSAPRSIDPYPFGGTPTASLKEHVFEALIASDDSPLLATGWEWTSPTTLDVSLRKGVKFHNGADFTARDVVYSACRMMYRIDGKRNLLTSSMGPLTNVVALDDHTVRFETKSPYPIWIQKMKFLSILSASDAELPDGPITYDAEGNCGITAYPTRDQFENGDAAIGTGPFTIDSFDKVGEATLTRFDGYWGEASEWESVEIRTIGNPGARLAGLFAGDFDLIENPTTEDLATLDSNPDYGYSSKPSWRSIFLVMDVNGEGAPGVIAEDGSAPLANPLVRKAMSLAVNRQAITDRLFGGNATVANQFSPSYRAGAPELPELEYNPERAKELLAEAGYPNGFTVEFAAPADRYANGARVAQAVTQYLSRIGIKVNLKTQPWSVFAGKRKERELGLFLYGWGHTQGPAQMISFAFASRDKDLGLGSSNYSNYTSAEFDKAIRAWAVETDQAKADMHVADAMKVAMDDLPGIPLYYQHSIWAHRSDLTVDGRQDERTNAAMVSKK